MLFGHYRTKNPRRKRNPITGKTVLIGAGVVGALLFATQAFAAPSRKRKTLPDVCDPSPYVFNENVVRQQINLRIDEGAETIVEVAADVANEMFGQFPGGGTVTFPPQGSVAPGVTCVWQRTLAMVELIADERGLKPKPDGPGAPVDFDDVKADTPGYPWEIPSLHHKNYPTPSTFFDLNVDDAFDPAKGFYKITEAALASAVTMAGGDWQVVKTPAFKPLREAYRELLMCGEYNDGIFGQTDPKKSGAPATQASLVQNVKGRGPNMLPRQYNNLQRMAEGQSPKRSTRINGNKLAGVQGAHRQMQMWLPAIDLAALVAPVPSIRPLVWSDGSSTKDPPPVVQALGLDLSGVNLPGGVGC